ncbi:uncharacterized protein LOC131851521 [Achroia grisella]|uniref:uncharacterized protein LOC131851521 n=1 Tax=Achroia grisella TaxID=688607 RepID=UPI0027D2EE41|nr:uncharacterized protein LOC131851521 [Achroia grisella]
MKGSVLTCNYNNTDYPNIQDMFSILKNNETNLPANVKTLNINLDIEKLDVNKFKRKMEMFEKEMTGKLRDVDNNTVTNGTLVRNDTRRFYIPNIWYGWSEASTIAFKLKTLDMMLQIIYMARFKIKRLESSKYFNRRDTGYRIAFLYKRLRRICRKLLDIYITLLKNRNTASDSDYSLSGHQRAIRYHVDFLYLWWVLVRMDGKHQDQHEPTSPMTITVTTPHRGKK